jgi:hypothetical protein
MSLAEAQDCFTAEGLSAILAQSGAEHTAKEVRIPHLSILCSGGVYPRRCDSHSLYWRRQATPLRNDGSSRFRSEIYLGGMRSQCQQQLLLSSALLRVPVYLFSASLRAATISSEMAYGTAS